MADKKTITTPSGATVTMSEEDWTRYHWNSLAGFQGSEAPARALPDGSFTPSGAETQAAREAAVAANSRAISDWKQQEYIRQGQSGGVGGPVNMFGKPIESFWVKTDPKTGQTPLPQMQPVPRFGGQSDFVPEFPEAAIAAFKGDGGRSKYYAFRQGLEERRAQEMLTPSAYEGFQVGKARREAAGQALVGAERWKQVASGARGAMDTSPVSAFGGEFRQGSMGQFSPIQKPTYTQGISGMQNMFAPAAQATPATMLPAMNETRQNAIQLGTSGTPFSFTPFSSNLQTLNEPFQGLAFAAQPQRRDTRFTLLPFGLRKQTA
jgi:hypothetical protein